MQEYFGVKIKSVRNLCSPKQETQHTIRFLLVSVKEHQHSKESLMTNN